MFDELFNNPGIFASLVLSIVGGLLMRKFGQQPQVAFAVISGFVMVIFGWWFISAIDFSFYPSLRQLLAIALLALFGVGMVSIKGKQMRIVGSIVIVIAVFAFSRTAPFENVNLSDILSGQVLDNARNLWSSIFNEAAQVVE